MKRFEIIDRCLFWKEEKTLIVGDLHLGYENYLMNQGASFPKRQMDETLNIFKKIFKKIGKVEKIILLGDIKHHFAGILYDEKKDFIVLMNYLQTKLIKGGKIIITLGNHDSFVKFLLNKLNFIETKNCFFNKGVLFLHGDKFSLDKCRLDLTRKDVDLVVIGHFHPAVILREGNKSEKYKCFIFGRDKILRKKLLILPSFFPLIEGSDIFSEINWEKRNISNFEVYVLDSNGKVYDFGKIKK